MTIEARAARVVVIILTVNQKEKTLACLAALRALDGPPFEILVWDNGSDDGTGEAVRTAFAGVVVHHHPTNLGVASGRNAAAGLAARTMAPTHLLFLDNDILVTAGFVVALLAPFGEDPGVGQTQAKLRFMNDRERLNDGGGCRIRFWLAETRPVGVGEIDRGQYDTPGPCIACGGAMMTRLDVFQELGGFDPVFDPFGPEDLDYSLRLQKAGHRAVYVPSALCFHEVSHTYGGGYTESYARTKVRNWFVFLRRHAPLHQKLAFYVLGLPFLSLRAIVRQARGGNLGVLRGLVRGLLDRRGSHAWDDAARRGGR